MRYLIYAPPYTHLSAGIKCLYMLRDALVQRGEVAEMVPMAILPFPEVNDDDVVVYPEIVTGNPLGAKHVVRWLLYYWGRYRNTGRYPHTDLVYGYTKRVAEHYGTEKILFMPSVDTTEFILPSEGTKRSGACFYAHKYRMFYRQTPQNHGIEITNPGQSRADVVKLLQTSEVFYAYEDTALINEAVLCGCPAVCVPTKSYWVFLADHEFKAGIAWGEDNLEQALSTIKLAPYEYSYAQDMFKEQLTEFISETHIMAGK